MRDGWKARTLGEICNLTKGTTPTLKAVPGRYPLVVTAADFLTSENYQFEGEAVCVPMVSSTGHGHASLKRVHYVRGKFAVANIITALQRKADAPVDMKFLWLLLDHGKDEIIVPLMKGTANVSLSQKALSSATINLPPLPDQRRIVDLISALDDTIAKAECCATAAQEARRAYVRAISTEGDQVTIESVAVVSQGRSLPKKVQGTKSGNLPWFKIADMAQPHNMFGYRQAETQMGLQEIIGLGGHIVPAGAVVFPRVGAAVQTEKKRLMLVDGAVDENHLVLTPRSGTPSEVLLAVMENFSLSSLVQTGAVPSLNMGLIRATRVPWVEPAKATAAARLLGDMREAARARAELVAHLRTLRSNLLTVLLSGEHEIPESYDELLGEAS
ncbi:restriction endonuclease subunit S [Raineyella fluvialis]|uniref:Type I restriction modification DNA specificity domain-containing protein n=1 Tax=Raineyella fluvialis TaxID=2662261 RepID=A0A5Q2FAE7_9ACTN|nr:restriction endonuclease subunit S [Raineyella fluvialis]QGF23779.1 hypothetical protein Rai3103_08945 [Raineyella fluvialis]